MKSHLFALAILALPLAVPASAAAPGFADLTVEEQADLTCGTAIATIVGLQEAEMPEAIALGPLEERGEAWFVETAIPILMKYQFTDEAFEALLIAQSEAMVADPPKLFALAPTCISRMEAAGF